MMIFHSMLRLLLGNSAMQRTPLVNNFTVRIVYTY